GQLHAGRSRPLSVEGRGRAFPALRKTAEGTRRGGKGSAERHPCLPFHAGGPGSALPHRPARGYLRDRISGPEGSPGGETRRSGGRGAQGKGRDGIPGAPEG